MRHTKLEHIAIADKWSGKPCKLYTLDGIKDALICGRLERFATIVVPHDGGANNIQVNWPTVARKMEGGDFTFYAC